MRSAFVLLALLTVGCGTTTRDVAVVRHDVDLTLFADGSVEARESIWVRSLGPGATFVRAVPAVHLDRITDVSSTLDTVAGGEVHVDRSGGLHASWTFRSEPAGHVVTLQYRVAGALAAQETRGLLRWKALPAYRRLPLATARINISVANSGHFVAGPAIDDGRVQFVAQGSQAHAELTDIQPNEQTMVSADVEFGSGGMPEPAWQTNATLARRLMPAFVAGGVCLLVIGIGIVTMIRLQYAPASRKTIGGSRDVELATVVRGLLISGVVAMVVAIAGAVVIDQTLRRFGIWPMAVPAGVFSMGIIFLWTSMRWRRAARQ